ncbi:cutinase family protein [Leucobacter sp. gxy201]|uniref:cutinase family protein n=1 Tax=Leucobacter sp. gxy201 TaxID=2957200 RepID=UPI003DA13525
MRESALRFGLGSGLLVALGLGLAGCAQPADPVVARESLEQVTEDPAPPDAAEEYDASLHPAPIVAPNEDCTPVLVITVRGTGEPTKGQLVSGIAKAIEKAEPDKTEVIDLDYPADTEVKEGGTLGVRTLIDTLNVQAEHCPGQQFVLLGYSQGALVIGDALSAPDTRLVGATAGEVGIDAAAGIWAVALFGDPRFNAAEAFNAGTYDSAYSGLLPRPSGALAAYEERLLDFCVAEDFICQSGIVLRDDGEIDEEGHVDYFKNGMRKQAAAFVLEKLGWNSAAP